MVLATSVVFRDTFSVGSCCANPNSVGERTAGHMNRKNTQELTSWSQTSWLLWLWQRCRNAENTRFSSLQSGHMKVYQSTAKARSLLLFWDTMENIPDELLQTQGKQWPLHSSRIQLN